MPMTQPELGRALAAIRGAARLTQTQLGDDIGLTQSAISAIEQGVNEPPLSKITRWVERCGRRLSVSFVGAEDPSAALITAARSLSPSDLALLLRFAAALPSVDPTVKEGHVRAMEIMAAVAEAARR